MDVDIKVLVFKIIFIAALLACAAYLLRDNSNIFIAILLLNWANNIGRKN